MSDYPPIHPDIHHIVNTDLNLGPGVTLTDLQRKHVGLVLDLFQARGTWAKLQDNLTEDAVYEDMFATAGNLEEVAGQFLGLPVVTTASETLSHTITSVHPPSPSENQNPASKSTHPLPLDKYPNLSQIDIKFNHRFTFKPLGNKVEMNSTLVVFSDEGTGKIVRIQDRPVADIPDNSLVTQLRKLNAVIAPKLLGIPKTEEEDKEKAEKRGAI